MGLTGRRCGPCKMIYPQLCDMAKEYEEAGVEIVKFECNKANKELGMKVGRQPCCSVLMMYGSYRC